ncbi:UDP-glucose 4-epimerase GalE [Streptomyces phyllanthi]|uniref:UDP-glucose 4-epimerase n=1 Tax=Streptomyces phyllanthi TaxID=1803180 RepID=A0A5N8W2T0_9ACTN|nr:UDP-glucose 4-epimerase GalE [Streptomyces phyllanthi]MPY41432.1 UDP-glucose 4-epimerase GalE [Streptomyces phyllanthi]
MSHPRTVLVTGGAGFIGSHTCVDLLAHDYEVVVVDNHSNSSPRALERIAKIAGRPLAGIHQLDLRDHAALSRVFTEHDVDAVVHFAAGKAVGESVRIPVEYYDNNVGGTTSLLRAMREHAVTRLVFSSSCSVYGNAEDRPLTEQDPARPTNPYAKSKWLCEQVLADVCDRWSDLAVLSLRYFNPIGAHPSGLLGEDPCGVPLNVMPYLMRVADGRLPHLNVFGGDYPTPDGTAVRDYVHVMDIAEGHRIALERIADASTGTAMRVFNLGTGVGTSVLELVAAFGDACGREVPYRMKDRRPGDVPCLVADASAVAQEWGWRPTRGLAEMCRDSWRFQQLNPLGYLQ